MNKGILNKRNYNYIVPLIILQHWQLVNVYAKIEFKLGNFFTAVFFNLRLKFFDAVYEHWQLILGEMGQIRTAFIRFFIIHVYYKFIDYCI